MRCARPDCHRGAAVVVDFGERLLVLLCPTDAVVSLVDRPARRIVRTLRVVVSPDVVTRAARRVTPGGRGRDVRVTVPSNLGVLMRSAALVVIALLALAGCSSEPATAPAPPAVATTTAAAPTTQTSTGGGYSTPIADLPAAPALETWVEKGSDFQQTLDLKMQTAMIEQLMMQPRDADQDAARALAYFICSELRGGPSAPGAEIVRVAYPSVDSFDAARVALAAQAYCLDTFSA